MKKILALAISAIIVIAITGIGSWAYFNDIETSSGNVFSAGTLDLKTSNDATNYFDGVMATWSGSNMAPSTGGSPITGTVTLKNMGTLGDHLEFKFANTVTDNTTAPEILIMEGTYANGTATSGTTATLVDATLTGADNYWNGKVLFIGSLPCRVIGVTREKDGPMGNSSNLEVWLPYSSTMNRLSGQHYFSSISVRVKDGISNQVAEQSITRLMTRRHGRKDFYTNSSDSILKTINKTTTTLKLMISAIAVISLIVGGIGVMNIMLVSVTERTHEIGIRMAVGARQEDIMQQFLIESVLVCLLGGMIGIVCSWGVGKVFSLFVSSFSMQFSLMSLISAFLCSTLIGVIFGFLPARNAARLDPIEALARE